MAYQSASFRAKEKTAEAIFKSLSVREKEPRGSCFPEFSFLGFT